MVSHPLRSRQLDMCVLILVHDSYLRSYAQPDMESSAGGYAATARVLPIATCRAVG